MPQIYARNYRYAIIPYEPEDEFELRRHVQETVGKLSTGGWHVLSLSMQKLLLNRLRKIGDDVLARMIAAMRQAFRARHLGADVHRRRLCAGITPIDALTFEFNFEATVAAQNKFMSLLPGTSASGGKQIDLKMGKLSNDELLAGTWQGRFGVHDWDPNTVDAALIETQPMLVAVNPRSSNAYLDYKKLYADGKLEVGAQFGWDYNAGRADLANAEQLYDELVDIGFESPVAAFKDLKLDSAPLARASIYMRRDATWRSLEGGAPIHTSTYGRLRVYHPQNALCWGGRDP